MLAQRDLDLHAGIGRAAEHLDDAGDRLALGGRVLDDLDDDDVAGFRLAAVVRRNDQVLRDAAVLGDDEEDAPFVVQAADDLAVRPLEHLDDLALGAPAPVGAGDSHRDAVAVQRLVHLARGQGDVGTARIGNEEAVPVRVAFEPPGDQVELGGDAELALAVDEDLAPGLQVRDGLVERRAPGPLEAEAVGELVGRERDAGVDERGEDGGGGWLL